MPANLAHNPGTQLSRLRPGIIEPNSNAMRALSRSTERLRASPCLPGLPFPECAHAPATLARRRISTTQSVPSQLRWRRHAHRFAVRIARVTQRHLHRKTPRTKASAPNRASDTTHRTGATRRHATSMLDPLSMHTRPASWRSPQQPHSRRHYSKQFERSGRARYSPVL